MVLFVFQFYPVCNFGKFIKFCAVRSERSKGGGIHSNKTPLEGTEVNVFWQGHIVNEMPFI